MKSKILILCLSLLLTISGCLAVLPRPDADPVYIPILIPHTPTPRLTQTPARIAQGAPITATLTMTTTAVVSATGTITGTPKATVTMTGTITETPTTTRTSVATGTRRSTPTSDTTPTRSATRRPTSRPTSKPTKAPTTAPTKVATKKPPATRTPAPPSKPTAVPVDTVFVRSHTSLSIGPDMFVVGEVMNGVDYPVFGVRIIAAFYDSNGNLVGANEVETMLPRIEAGLPSPFKLKVGEASNVDRYELTVAWDEFTVVNYEEMTVLTQDYSDEERLEVFGDIRNDGSTAVNDVRIVVTFYDASGEVIDNVVGVAEEIQLDPGQRTSYTIEIPTAVDFQSFVVQSQARLALY